MIKARQKLSSASRERQALAKQLRRPRASRAGAAPQSSGGCEDAQNVTVQEAITLQEGILLMREQKARAAAERRAADLEQKLSAQQSQMEALKDECTHVSAERDEIAEQLIEFEATQQALVECDMELTASKVSNEQAEQLITELQTQLKEATAARTVAEQQNSQLISQLQDTRSAKARIAAELRKAEQACQVAQAAAEKEAKRAADLAASRAAMEQQMAYLHRSNKVTSTPIIHALPSTLSCTRWAAACHKHQDLVCGAQRGSDLHMPALVTSGQPCSRNSCHLTI